MFKLFVIVVLVKCALAAPTGPPHPGKHAPPPPLPPPHPAPAPKHLPGPAPKHHGPGPKYHPMPYAYTYGVTDEYHGVDFGETKESDGNVVHGSYHVLLPDGRVQHVKYTADHYGGYVAEVSYESIGKPYHPPEPYHGKSAPPPAPPHKG